MPDPLVAVIAGGDSAEYEASIASGQHVFSSLRRRFSCVLLRLHRGQWSVLAHHGVAADGSELRVDDRLRLVGGTGRTLTPDIAVLCTHGFPGETGELQGFLAICGIPYASTGVLGSAIAADKFRCSQYLSAACGSTIPRRQRLRSAELRQAAAQASAWPPPFVLKPNSLGSSIGVVSLHDPRGIPAAFAEAAARGGDFVVEDLIDGLEITAGAVRFRTEQVLLPPAAVLRPGGPDSSGVRRFTDHRSVQLQIPAGLPAQAAALVAEQMQRIGVALDLRGCYRADFIWSKGRLYFLEVNTVPGLGENSVFTRLAAAAGLDLGVLLERVITETLTAAAE